MTQKSVDPQWIDKQSREVENRVCLLVEQAKIALGGDGVYNLEGGDFSITLSAASAAYPTAAQFGLENTEALKKEADEMARKLAVTAWRYQETEQANARR